MAYSIAYKESSPLTPYDDWIKRSKPNLFFIKFIKRNAKEYDCIFWPKIGLLKIWVGTAEHEFTVISRVNIDGIGKRIKILSSKVSSSRLAIPGYIHGKWKNEHGRTRMAFRMINEYKEMRVLENIAHNIFGKEYSFAPDGGNKLLENPMNLDIMAVLKIIENVVPCKFTPGSWTLLDAFCDMTKDNAAVMIQAAFRGWRVRMQYRYNPYNCLGRYVILKEAGFRV